MEKKSILQNSPSIHASTVVVASSSGLTVSDAENVDVDLDALMQQIYERLEAMKEKKSKKIQKRKETQKPELKKLDKEPKQTTSNFWPTTSAGFSKLRELVSEGTTCLTSLNDQFPSHEANTVVRGFLKEIGQVHWAAAGLLVISNILEKIETIKSNRDGCLSLLDEMYRLAKHIKQLRERHPSKDMENLMKEGTVLIVKGSLMCCTQIDRSSFSSFFSTSVEKDDLLLFEQKLQKFDKEMLNQRFIWLYDRIECKNVSLSIQRKRAYPEYAVGIEEPLNRVIELLDWESEEKAVAVVLHGLGGTGKTTLANALFARLYIKECKYSMVRMCDDIQKPPKIVKLQKFILQDLEEGLPNVRTEEHGQEMPHIRTYEDGQLEISRILSKEVAFIYIDNVSDGASLEELLPRKNLLKNVKKLRVLITSRNNLCIKCMITKTYTMKGLDDSEAMILLNKEMEMDGAVEQIERDRILKYCCGNPKLLTVVAHYIRSEQDKKKACRTFMQSTKGHLEKYIFAYDHLPDEKCKDAFLDICSFFKGWEWETVEIIMGESVMDELKKRALVSKDENMTVDVHDVILTIGKEKAENTRFTEATASQLEGRSEEFIKVIKGLWFKDQLYNLSATKLDSMCDSLRILKHGDLSATQYPIISLLRKWLWLTTKCNKIFQKLVFYQGKTPYFPFDLSQFKEFKDLRYLHYQPRNLDLLSKMPLNLEHMELDGILYSSRSFDISYIEHLQDLKVLRLINFKELKTLTVEWKKNSLQELSLSHCTSIEKLTGLRSLSCLRVLRLNHCEKFHFDSELWSDFEYLSALHLLDFSHCYMIEELPESISKLQSLKILRMNSCVNLKRLPTDLSSSLKELNLWGCKNLKVVPTSLAEVLDMESRALLNYKGVLLDHLDSDPDYESDADSDSDHEVM